MSFESQDVREGRGQGRTGLFARIAPKRACAVLAGGRRAGVGPAFVAFALVLAAAAFAAPTSALSPLPPQKAEIVFSNGGRIVSIKADGSQRKVLTRRDKAPVHDPWDRNHDSSPSISPDGGSLLFLRTFMGKGARQVIMVAGRDGGSPRAVVTRRTSPSKGVGVDLSGPVWSRADGRILFIWSRMAFSEKKGRSFTSFRDDVISVSPDGTGAEVLLTRRVNSSFGKQPPGAGSIEGIDVSADGRKLLVSGQGGGERERIDVIDLSSGASRLIRKDGREARWSPDGTRILFTSEHQKIGKRCKWMDGCFYDDKLYVMNDDGSGVRRIQPGRRKGFQNGGHWSPDGSRILFWGSHNGRSTEIYSVRPDGSCLTWLTNGSFASSEPAWGPEPDRGPAPRECGGDRPPLVETSPRRQVRVNGRPATWTRLWLGPTFASTLYQGDGGPGRGFGIGNPLSPAGRGLRYGGCSRFKPADCPDVEYELDYQDVCKAWGSGMLDDGSYARLVKRRGALVMLATGYRGFPVDPLVLTGGQAVSVAVHAERRVTPAWRLKVIDALRPVGAKDASAPLAAAVLDRRMVRKAARISRKLKRSPVRAVSRKTGLSPKRIRTWARFHRDLKRVGPVRATSCKGWR